jgi:hypothetical protein
MKSYSILLFIACLFLVHPYSQIKGKCIDENGRGIPYVNISIKRKTYRNGNMEAIFYIENSSVEEHDFLLSHKF